MLAEQEAGREPSGYRHIAHLAASLDAAVPAAVPLLAEATGRGEVLLLATSGALSSALRAQLPADAAVTVLDDAPLAARTPDALVRYTELLDRYAPAPGHRLVLVTDSSRHRPGSSTWLQTQALLDHVLADRELDHLCLLGADTLAGDARCWR